MQAKEHTMKEHLLDSSFVVIDLETTGFDVNNAEIIDIGAVRVEGGIITDTFSSLVNPGFFIPERIRSLTGITNAMLVGNPKIEEVLPRFIAFLKEDIVVGHNVVQDLRFIDKYTRIYMKKKFKRPYVCTLQLSRKVLPDLESHSLQSLAHYFGIENPNPHRALSDALITAHVFLRLLELLWNNYGIGDYYSITRLAKTRRL